VSGPDLDENPDYGPAAGAVSNPLLSMSQEDISKLIRSVFVVILRRHEVAGELLDFTWNLGAAGIKFGNIKDNQGGNMETARGLCERSFLQFSDSNPDVKYLVFVDSDEDPGADAPLRLARWGLPIVSGVVCGYSPDRGVFACFMDYDVNGVARFPSYTYTKTMPARGLKKVYGAGTGLMCIRKDVLETMLDRGMLPFLIDEETRRESYRTGVQKLGEDMAFCQKARDLGFDIYVDFSVRANHFKMLRLAWPEMGLDDDLDPKDWKPAALDYKGPR
jgi:hypothetical protein